MMAGTAPVDVNASMSDLLGKKRRRNRRTNSPAKTRRTQQTPQEMQLAQEMRARRRAQEEAQVNRGPQVELLNGRIVIKDSSLTGTKPSINILKV